MIDIIVPTLKNRENILIAMLASMIPQTFSEWNLMICTNDNELENSSSHLKKLLETFEINYNKKVTIIVDKINKGPSFAVQNLVNSSKSEVVIRVDDDVILTPQVFQKLVQTYKENKNVGAIACPVNGFGVPFIDYKKYWKESADSNTTYKHLFLNGRYEKMNDNFSHHSSKDQSIKFVAETDFLSGYCVLMDKKKFDSVEGYKDAPHHHKEDFFLFLKMKVRGYRMLIRGDAVAFHCHRMPITEPIEVYRKERSKIDNEIFEKYKNSVTLPEERHIGLLE